jgi:hypothetical protein
MNFVSIAVDVNQCCADEDVSVVSFLVLLLTTEDEVHSSDKSHIIG